MSPARRSVKAQGARPLLRVGLALPTWDVAACLLLRRVRTLCRLSTRDRRRRGIEPSWSSSAGTVGTVVKSCSPEDGE